MTLVGKEAPQVDGYAIIDGKTIVENYSLEDLKDKYTLLFFYPLDFTFVCPTELHAFQEKLSEFEKRHCQVVGCSVDSHYCHLAWLNTPKNEGGIQGITYPLLADTCKSISKAFDVLDEEKGIAYRAQFLIDKEGVVRHALINDLPLGRNVDEALRIVDSWQFFEKHGEVCPANWKEGDKAMKPDQEGLKDYFRSGS